MERPPLRLEPFEFAATAARIDAAARPFGQGGGARHPAGSGAG